MAYRIVAGVLLYVVLPLLWVSLGLIMLLAPVRFAGFIDENIIALSGGRLQGFVASLAVRAVGAGFIAFAVRFVLHIVAVFR